MTRINLVPPSELADQHLFAEFREIKMIAPALRRSLRNHTVSEVLKKIPAEFTLGKGHVMFFYNKATYLHMRYSEIHNELDKRGVSYNKESPLDPNNIFMSLGWAFWNNYTPTPQALQIIRQRITERIAKQPKWYRFYGNSIYV